MSDKLADGWYVITYPGQDDMLRRVEDGRVDDGNGEFALTLDHQGYVFRPVEIISIEEYDRLTQKQQNEFFDPQAMTAMLEIRQTEATAANDTLTQNASITELLARIETLEGMNDLYKADADNLLERIAELTTQLESKQRFTDALGEQLQNFSRINLELRQDKESLGNLLENVKAELAASKRYVPLSDGVYDAQHEGDSFEIDRDSLKVYARNIRDGAIYEEEIALPDGYAVCKMEETDGQK